MLKVGRSVAVDIPRFRLPDVTCPSFGTVEQSPLFAHVITRVPEFAPVTEQKYRLITPENRQLKFTEQISQSTRGQAQTVPQTSRKQWRRPTQPVVKQSGGFGPTTTVRLETDRHKTHLGSIPDTTRQKRGRGSLLLVTGQRSLQQPYLPPPP